MALYPLHASKQFVSVKSLSLSKIAHKTRGPPQKTHFNVPLHTLISIRRLSRYIMGSRVYVWVAQRTGFVCAVYLQHMLYKTKLCGEHETFWDHTKHTIA